MRNYNIFDGYLNELSLDIYPQPPDKGHTAWAKEVFDRWNHLWATANSVLDVGCGEGFIEPWFTSMDMKYTGVCIGIDKTNAIKQHRLVYEMDFHFLDFPDNSFDLVFSRHSLEHSPMPMLALMEWHRVSSKYMCLVLPNPEFFIRVGRNHYSLMYDDQASFLLRRTGWSIVEKQLMEHELQYFCTKVDRPNKEYVKSWD